MSPYRNQPQNNKPRFRPQSIRLMDQVREVLRYHHNILQQNLDSIVSPLERIQSELE